MQTKTTGAWQVGPVVVSVLAVTLPTAWNASLEGGLGGEGEVTRLYARCPLVLVFGREVKGLQVREPYLGRRGGTFKMPSRAEWLDSAKARGAVLCARLRNVTSGLWRGPLRQQLPLLLWEVTASLPTHGALATSGVTVGIPYFHFVGCGHLCRVPLFEKFGHVVKDQVELKCKQHGGKENAWALVPKPRPIKRQLWRWRRRLRPLWRRVGSPFRAYTSPATCSAGWQRQGESQGPAGTPARAQWGKRRPNERRDSANSWRLQVELRRARGQECRGAVLGGAAGSWGVGSGGHVVALVGWLVGPHPPPPTPGSRKGSGNPDCAKGEKWQVRSYFHELVSGHLILS